ncbi:MAG TPA: alpha/beta fold hydrolase [Gemmataceae bacterium]|nr:alpha/beta fold hydrolase [Gemmataceae bacterium]
MPQYVEVPLPGRESLRGDLRPGGPSDLAIVYVHGFGSHRGGEKAVSLAAECTRRGWTFAAFDFRGHGETGGEMRALTASRLLEDLSAVRAFLSERGYPRLGLVGSSMGAFAAAWFAARYPEAVAGCVLIAPAFRFLDRRWDELTPAERDEWARTGVRRLRNEWVDVEIGYGLVAERAAYDPTELARRWRTPLLIFHGMADDVVPAADSLAFVEATSYPDVELRLIKAGDHRLTTFKDEIAVEVCRFLTRVAGQNVQS